MFKILNLKTFATPSLCQILTLKANMCKNYPQICAKMTHKYVPKLPTNEPTKGILLPEAPGHHLCRYLQI